MAEANSNKILQLGSLVRRDRPQLPPPETGQAEGLTSSAARRRPSDMSQMRAGIHALIRSAFGLVPSFLRRLEDAEAILRYKPPGPCRS